MKIKLGNITKIKTGKLDANASSVDGQYPFFTCSKETLKIDSYSYDCECVLVAGNGDLNVKYYKGKFDAYQRTYIIEDNSNGTLYMPYLYMFLDSYVEELRKQSVGGVIKYIKLGNLTDALIDLPSIEEQKKVVSILEKNKLIISNKNKEKQRLDELVKGRFIELFGECKKERLGDFCSTHARIGWQKLTRAEFLEKGDYYLVTGWDLDTKRHRVDFSKCYYVTKERYEQDKKLILKEGDVLLTKDGTLGKVALIEKMDKPATLNGHIFVIRPLDNRLTSKFLVGCFLSDDFKYQMEINKTGSTIVGVTQKALLEFEIPVAPVELQNEYAEFVEKVDKSKVVLQKSIDETQKLFDSLMQKYFG